MFVTANIWAITFDIFFKCFKISTMKLGERFQFFNLNLTFV